MKVRKYGENIRLIFNIMSFCRRPYLDVSKCSFQRQPFILLLVTLKKLVTIIFDFKKIFRM